jgi:hypothetical protein
MTLPATMEYELAQLGIVPPTKPATAKPPAAVAAPWKPEYPGQQPPF